MKKEDVTIKNDGTIECFIVLSNNPCIATLVPTKNMDLRTLKRNIESSNALYFVKDDLYKLCNSFSDKTVFSNITIINPNPEKFGEVIEIDENLKYKDKKIETIDDLHRLVDVEKIEPSEDLSKATNVIPDRKLYFCYYSM